MRKIVSFFRHRDDDPGESWAFEAHVQGVGKVEVSFYSRGPLSKEARAPFADPGRLDEKGYRDLLHTLSTVLRETGGGIVIELWRTGEGASFVVTTVESRVYAPARRFLVLQLGYPPELATLQLGRANELITGSRLLFPVDGRAEQHLEAFLGYLRWLSPDVESLVLDGLTRPSLESRLDRLERRSHEDQVVAGSPSSAPRWVQRLPSWIPSFLLRPLPPPPLWWSRLSKTGLWVVVLALLLLSSSLLTEQKVRRAIEERTSRLQNDFYRLQLNKPVAKPPPNPVPVLADQASPPKSTPEQAVHELFEVLARLPPAEPRSVLFHSHFQPLAEAAALEAESFAWGLVKLLALKHGLVVEMTTLNAIGRRSDTKKHLIALLEKPLGEDEISLLRYVTCSAFKENRDRDAAGLPKMAGDAFEPRVEMNINCSEVEGHPDLAIPGLRALTTDLGLLQVQAGSTS